MNLFQAYTITILDGYICVVRIGTTALDQAYYIPPNVCHGPKNIRVVKKISKIVLGLEAEPQTRGLTITRGYHYTYW